MAVNSQVSCLEFDYVICSIAALDSVKSSMCPSQCLKRKHSFTAQCWSYQEKSNTAPMSTGSLDEDG